MAVFDVGRVLESVTGLQEKLDEAITKSKSLLEAIEGSQSKHTGLNGDYPVLRSLKARLAATQGPNEWLSTELIKFKFELEAFVEDVFHSHENARKDLQLWAKELEENREELRREKEDFLQQRRKFDMEQNETVNHDKNASENVRSENTDRTDNVNKPNQASVLVKEAVNGNDSDGQERNMNFDSTENRTVEQQIKNQPQETRNVGCQTETHFTDKKEAGLQTEQDVTAAENINEVTDYAVNANNLRESNQILSCRLQAKPAASCNQRVVTAPVSRARALLLVKQGYATRVNKAVLDEVHKLKEEVNILKLDNSALLKQANEAHSELFYMKNQLAVSVTDRNDIQKKFQKAREQIHKLESALRKQASGVVQNRKQQKQIEEEIRWSQILRVPLVPTSQRLKTVPQQEGKPFSLTKSFSGTRGR